MTHLWLVGLLALAVATLAACTAAPPASSAHSSSATGSTSAPVWAIAIHGGAGAIKPGGPPELEAAYRASLRRVLDEGKRRLARGDSSLDTCEALVRMLEDDELFNAGKGAVLTERAEVELDAAIMDGGPGFALTALTAPTAPSAPAASAVAATATPPAPPALRAGAVAGVKTVRHPISLARAVMEKTSHVLLIGPGAETFADTTDLERVPNTWFITPRRQQQLDDELRKRRERASPSASDRASDTTGRYGTVGVVALDSRGHLAAATSTGGMTGKMPGRVGDAPLIGSGTYATPSVAISCTGTGEQFIRNAVASGIAQRVDLLRESASDASEHYVRRVLKPGDGGLIAVDARGQIAMPYNSEGMYRAAADSTGRDEVRIWKN